jgi:SAM-dependent methyltransferase
MNNFWDERYGREEYVYGEEPNVFFADQIRPLKPASILFPCEGEGRNAIYAATHGWDVTAFDGSQAGREKALALAKKKGVDIKYTIDDAATITFPDESFDVVVFSYAHLPPVVRKRFNKCVIGWLKPGGRVIMEVFGKGQLQYKSGGPKDIEMLYSEDVLKTDFADLDIELLQDTVIELHEGSFHEGPANVVRFVGIKK